MELKVYCVDDFPPYHLYFYIPSFIDNDKANDIIWDALRKEGFVLISDNVL